MDLHGSLMDELGIDMEKIRHRMAFVDFSERDVRLPPSLPMVLVDPTQISEEENGQAVIFWVVS